MKKTILIILTFTLTINVYSQLKFGTTIEIGYSEFDETIYNNSDCNYIQYNSYNAYLKPTLIFNYGKFWYENIIISSIYYQNGYSLNIKEMIFDSKLYYNFKKIQFGLEHICAHPVINSINEFTVVNFKYRRMSESKIFVKIEFGNIHN